MNRDEPAWTPQLLDAPHEIGDKADRVRRMFNAIAPRYELVNHLFSAGRDAAWRRRAVKLAKAKAEDVVLDVACGTGDFARAFIEAGCETVIGCDFAHEMLIRATGRSPGTSTFCEADACRLPFRDAVLSIVSCAFGVRNFGDLDAGLREMHRVLKAGGRAVILEFTRPHRRLARGLYELYANRLMPVAASLVSGDRSGAYRYLPRSVVSFLDAEQMCNRLRAASFAHVSATPLTCGIVTVYVAIRE